MGEERASGGGSSSEASREELERLRREIQELKESEELFRILTDASPVGAYLVQDFKFLYVNPAFAAMFGYRPEEIVGRLGPLDLVHPDDRQLVEENVRKRLAGEAEVVRYTARGIRKDGTVIHGEIFGRRIDYRGRPAAIGTLVDLTPQMRLIARLEKLLEEVVHAFSVAVEVRDPYTARHQLRVATLSRAIAQELDLPPNTVRGIYFGGLLHDVGKLSIPTEILSKPTPLTPTERALVEQHTLIGHEILKRVNFPWPVAEMALQHHERMDGSGCPRKLKGDEIIPEARILAVADVVEAISHHRPYRPAFGLDAALEEIAANRGTLYDPQAVDACLRLFREKGFRFDATSPR